MKSILPNIVIAPELAVRVQDFDPSAPAPIDFAQANATQWQRQYSAVRRLWLFLRLCFGIIDESEPYYQRPDGIYLPYARHTLIYPHLTSQLVDCFVQYRVWIDDHSALVRHGKYRARPAADELTKGRTEPDVLAQASRTYIDLDDPSLTDHERQAAERIVVSRQKRLPSGGFMADGFHQFTIACAGAHRKDLWMLDPRGRWHSLSIPPAGTVDVQVRIRPDRKSQADGLRIGLIQPVSLARLSHGASMLITDNPSIPRPRANECIRYEPDAAQSIAVIFLPDAIDSTTEIEEQ